MKAPEYGALQTLRALISAKSGVARLRDERFHLEQNLLLHCLICVKPRKAMLMLFVVCALAASVGSLWRKTHRRQHRVFIERDTADSSFSDQWQCMGTFDQYF